MKKIALLLIFITLVLVAGCARNGVTIQYGVYPLKAKTFTIFDSIGKDITLYGQIAELTESKPENLTVDPAIKIEDPRYGKFTFGNNNRQVWFIMGQDMKGYWTTFYIDQNLDNQITQKEIVKGFVPSESREKKFIRRQAESYIPVPIQISYKGENSEFVKKLFFCLKTEEIEELKAKEYKKEITVAAFDFTFLEGEFPVQVDKKIQNCRFRISDTNGNGCFNDFGRDLLYLDLNNDGYFKKDEAFKLVEFMDRTEENKKTQFRLIVLPYPGKIALLNALEEYNPSDLEPVADPTDKTPETPTENPMPTPQPDTLKPGTTK